MTKPDISGLVYEMIVKWEKRIHKPIEYYGSDLVETLRYWVKVWVESDARFSTAFWINLKPEINHDFAWSSYFILMTASSQPKTFEKIGMTREQCVYEAFNFWMNGAVDMEALRAAQEASANRLAV